MPWLPILSTLFTDRGAKVKIGGEERMVAWTERLRMLLGWPSDSANRSTSIRVPKVTMEYLLDYHVDASSPEQQMYDFSDPFGNGDGETLDILIKQLSLTKPFQRLSDIRFLGALDYFLVPRPNGSIYNSRFNRAQHSIGVARLAKYYLSLTKHSEYERLVCVAAAMLHDIGHAPFSHTLEPVLKARFGLDHHSVSETIILGEAYSSEISKVLKSFGIDPADVASVLSSKNDQYGDFFSGPINFDTIEGILRSRAYLRMQGLGLTPMRVLHAAVKRDDKRSESIVDAFWACKDDVYNVVIRSKVGVIYDAVFQETARFCIDDFGPDDFYLTETQSFRKHLALREAAQIRFLPVIIERLMPDELLYQVRRFYVDQSASFTSGEDRRRYKHIKTDARLTRADYVHA